MSFQYAAERAVCGRVVGLVPERAVCSASVHKDERLWVTEQRRSPIRRFQRHDHTEAC